MDKGDYVTVDRGRSSEKPGYLHEVQGLRTIAALLVAIYHIWFFRVSGGVDVFFVVAAFFITRSLTKTDRPSFAAVGAFYLSTMRRIIPGLVIVVTATIGLVLAFGASSSWNSEIAHAVASLLFVENLNLIKEGRDYLTMDLAQSSFQQMWALSIQVQFYALFPLLIYGSALLSRRRGRHSIGNPITVVFAAIIILSLIWSVVMTRLDQPRAYFDPVSRAWEFAAGALLALHIDRIALSEKLARALGIAALVVLISFAALIDVSTSFPGILAAIPVASALSIIIAAQNGGRIPVLNWTIVGRAGDFSFSFYLWHWPLLIGARNILGRQDVGFANGALIIVASGWLAWASTRFVETPFRRSARLDARPAMILTLCALLTVPAFAGIAVAYETLSAKQAAARSALKSYIAIAPSRARPDALVPDPIIARDDLPPVFGDGCHQDWDRSEIVECRYGKRDGRRLVVLIGGSHSAQWLPALLPQAAKRDFEIRVMTKSKCYFSAGASRDPTADPSCAAWNAAALRRILEMRPDLVMTIATRGAGVQGEVMPDGYVEAWEIVRDAGIPVLALRDNPWFQGDPVRCVELNRSNLANCSMRRAAFYLPTEQIRNRVPRGVTLLDFSDDYCPGGQCLAAGQGLLRYLSLIHI